MGKLSKRSKEEMLKVSRSKNLCDDMKHVAEHRNIFTGEDSKRDVNKFMRFLNEYNRMINHRMKRFKKIEGSNWRI